MRKIQPKESHKFRDLIDLWEMNCQLDQEIEKINGIFDKHGMIVFFKKGNNLYGAPESSRLMFAKLKSNDPDNPITLGMKDQIRIPVIDLIKAMFGSNGESLEVALNADDVKDLEVYDRDQAIKTLIHCKK